MDVNSIYIVCDSTPLNITQCRSTNHDVERVCSLCFEVGLTEGRSTNQLRVSRDPRPTVGEIVSPIMGPALSTLANKRPPISLEHLETLDPQ
jgi:hypothetical protein